MTSKEREAVDHYGATQRHWEKMVALQAHAIASTAKAAVLADELRADVVIADQLREDARLRLVAAMAEAEDASE